MIGALALCTAGSLAACGSGSGGGGGSGSAALSCQAYCTSIMASCTGGDGSVDGGAMDPTRTHQQYTGMDQCVATCSTFPVGAASDTSGDTLGCRTYHAGAAATDPATHCPHAGPGGDGVCGDLCTSYCRITAKYCTAANMAGPLYTSDADCMSWCKATKSDLRFNIAVQAGDEQACLLYHSQEASVVPPDHCNGDLAKDPKIMGHGSVTCQ